MNPLSNELFFEAHRGVKQNLPGSSLHKDYIGMHWSVDKEKAAEFALRRGPGAIIHGKIPISSVETSPERLIRKIGEGWDRQDLQDWQLKDTFGEKEVPVKLGAPVMVTGVTHFRGSQSSRGGLRGRTRTYNPPREMRA